MNAYEEKPMKRAVVSSVLIKGSYFLVIQSIKGFLAQLSQCSDNVHRSVVVYESPRNLKIKLVTEWPINNYEATLK